jgi:hypothetical protein
MALELIEIGHVEAVKGQAFCKASQRARKVIVGAELNRPAEKTNFTFLLCAL